MQPRGYGVFQAAKAVFTHRPGLLDLMAFCICQCSQIDKDTLFRLNSVIGVGDIAASIVNDSLAMLMRLDHNGHPVCEVNPALLIKQRWAMPVNCSVISVTMVFMIVKLAV